MPAAPYGGAEVAMARCRFLIEVPKGKPPHTWKSKTTCPKSARTFYRVTYDKDGMTEYHARMSQKDSVLGFCPDHAPRFSRMQGYVYGDWESRNVRDLLGPVTSVEVIDAADGAALFEDDGLQKQMAAIRSQVARMMGQKNNANLDPDAWQGLFEELVREFTVRWVLKQ